MQYIIHTKQSLDRLHFHDILSAAERLFTRTWVMCDGETENGNRKRKRFYIDESDIKLTHVKIYRTALFHRANKDTRLISS